MHDLILQGMSRPEEPHVGSEDDSEDDSDEMQEAILQALRPNPMQVHKLRGRMRGSSIASSVASEREDDSMFLSR